MEHTLSRLSLQIKFCHYCRHDADWRETKTKTDYTIWNIHKGSLVIQIGERELTASEGDVLFFHPGDSYTAFSRDECCHFLVTFFTFDTGNSLDLFQQCNSAGVYSNADLRNASHTLCRSFLHICGNTPSIPLEMYAGFLFFLTCFLPCLGTQRRFYDTSRTAPVLKIHQLLSYLEENVEKNIPIKEMASFMGMSEKYFIQFFHSHTGYSPKQYRIHQRMNHSVKLLADPANTLAHIAMRLHFSDQYAFAKAFKNYYGESPGAFRKQYVNDSGSPIPAPHQAPS